MKMIRLMVIMLPVVPMPAWPAQGAEPLDKEYYFGIETKGTGQTGF